MIIDECDTGYGGKICPGGDLVVTGGTDKTFTATPEAGHYVSRLVVDGEEVGGPYGLDEVVEHTFSNVRENHAILVQFAAAG